MTQATPSDPLPPSQESITFEQTMKGDRNQTIGQVLGGMVIYVSGGQAIINTGREEPAPDEKTIPLGPNPYRGLMAFQETDGDRFFGRDKQIAALWEKLRSLHETASAMRVLPIYGPSGCGKSSLARAGLIPELARHPIPGYDQARVAILVPGTHPLESLATILARIVTEDLTPVAKTREFAGELKQVNEAGKYDGLRRIADVMPDIAIKPLVVLVDQFEEVYTLCEDKTERDAFIENLLHAAGDRTKRVTVIITLRSDFLGETQKHPVLNQLFSEQGYLVPAMTPEELRQAIAKPAELADYPLDTATIDLLVKDTEGREGALPLLQFALTRIWEGLAKGKQPAETLQAIGGVGGALAGEAQRIYDSLDEKGRAIARRLFLGLVQLGEGTKDTRRRATLDSLVSYRDQPPQVKQVINAFAAPGVRLITLSANGTTKTAEITHEALFEHWQQLQSWLEESRNDIRFQRRLDEAARYWNEQGRPEGSLWRPPDLDLLQQYKKRVGENMTALQREFWRVSRQAERKRLYLRQLVISGLMVSLLLTTYQWHRAERQRMQQYEATAKQLEETNPGQSLVNGLAAVGLGRSPFVRMPSLNVAGLVSDDLLVNPSRAIPSRPFQSKQEGVYAIAVSPDGEHIVSGGKDGSVRLWNLEGKPIGEPFGGPFRKHQGEVTSVAFSPDGQHIASGSDDGTVMLWDLKGRHVGQPFKGHEKKVESVAFSPDGQHIVSGGFDGKVRLWDLKGNPIGQPFPGSYVFWVFSAAFSPDGQRIVSAGDDGLVRLWDLKGNPIGQPFQGHTPLDPGHPAWVESVAFSPDGQHIASAGSDGTIRLWNLEGKSIGQPFQGHQGKVKSVAFSSDSQRIVSAGDDGTVRLWNLEGKPIGRPFQGHQGWVESVAFTPDGQHIVSGGEDDTIRLWEVDSNLTGQLFQVQSDEKGINAVAFSPDGQYMVSGGEDNTVRLWDLEGNPIGQPFEGHWQSVKAVAFSPDGQHIVSGSEDGTLRLWNLEGKPIGKPFQADPGAWVNAVAFSPDGRRIAFGGFSVHVQLWDLEGRLIGQSLQAHESWVTAIAFSPDGQRMVSADMKGTMRLWDSEGNPIGKPFRGHHDWIRSVTFSPDGQRIVSGGDDGTVRLWNLEGKPIGKPFRGPRMRKSFRNFQEWVNSVAFSPDGQHIVSGGNDGTVRLWNLEGKPIGQPFPGHGLVNAVAFSPDGKHIVIGSTRGVQLWNQWPWPGWLAIACQRVAFVNGDDVDKEAEQTCQRYAWKP